MKHGFIKVCAATFENEVANCAKNAEKIIETVKQVSAMGVKLAVFPELCLCGSTCGDLFLNDTLLRSATEQLCRIARQTSDTDTIIILGFPFVVNDKIYNCAAVCQKGDVLGIVPKRILSATERRYFSAYCDEPRFVTVGDTATSFGNVIFAAQGELSALRIGVEIGQEAFAAISPSCELCASGATVIANPFAAPELVGDDEYRKVMLASLSARNVCGYVHAGAGDGESTTDAVFGGYCAIYENGKLLAEKSALSCGADITVTDLDLQVISSERRSGLEQIALFHSNI